MDNRIVRVLICLLLVCSLLVNVSPIRAEALALESAAAYYALGLAALLLLDLVGVVYCLSTPEQIQALGKNWDRFMIDGSSAFDYDLEEWEEYKTATIIQFTPNSDPENDDDFPDGYDPNKIRLKTLEAALNYGICKWLESIITGDNPLISYAVSSVDRSYLNPGDVVSAGTEVGVPALLIHHREDGQTISSSKAVVDSFAWTNVDCYVYQVLAGVNGYSATVVTVFIPVDLNYRSGEESFKAWKNVVYQDGHVLSDSDTSTTVDITYDDGSVETIAYCIFSGRFVFSAFAAYFDELLQHYDSSLPDYSSTDTMVSAILTSSFTQDNNVIVDPDLVTGTVVEGVENGTSVSDMELPDIEYGAIITDPADPETSIKENQEQIANGDKTYEDYIEEVAPGESVVIPEPTVTPETEPSVAPEVDPSESPEVNPDPDPTTSVDPTPDSGTDANPSWLESLLNGLWELLQRLADLILNGIKSIFVPSEDYLTAKVNALRENFGFIDSVINTGEYIRDSISGSSGPPEIYVDLTAADGDTNWGEKVLLTDFSWYAPYKSNVDTVLSAALWAFFGWRVFMRLPGIISGESGYVGDFFRPRDKSKKE